MDYYALQNSLSSSRGWMTAEVVKLESHFKLLEKVGQGAYGVVWKARKLQGKAGEIYAVKQIDKRCISAKGLREAMGEVETMTLLEHPHIVKLEEMYQDDENLWIVMEYLSGGALQGKLKKCGSLAEPVVRRLVMQLLMAVEYIHERGIVHRDLKPSNCLLSSEERTVKISDFGFAVFAGSDQCLRAYCGTVPFMAPEILLKANYGKPVDMWALGVMTYLLCVGKYPFTGSRTSSLTTAICKHRCQLNCEPLVQWPLLLDFVSQLLVDDPNKRLSAKSALKHPWMKVGSTPSPGANVVTESPEQYSVQTGHAVKLLRSATIAIMAVHRLRFLLHYRHLVRVDCSEFPILRSFRYAVAGRYEPEGYALDCGSMFLPKPAAICELIPMIETSRTVQHVNLSNNGIDSLGLVQSLLKVISRHPSIVSLNLSNNPIPAVAGRGLLRLARSSTSNLRRIDVEGTLISAEIATQISTSLKDRELAGVCGDAPHRDLSDSIPFSSGPSRPSLTRYSKRERVSHRMRLPPLPAPKRVTR